MKSLAILIVILSVGWFITFRAWLSQKEINQAQELKISSLQTELEKRNKNAVETSKRIRELEEAAKADNSNMDWNLDISSSSVVKRLQSQCMSCK